ncbi:fad nadp-binding domain-containing [Trichoderma arundinaceum]|uniref:Fad nadp-binding domain-containing n=1 Tax=Trichoderma arundinaceum TaxID=490622 RepID=A0A395NTS9_TRIAR|nr:fad nadp-binding domain-containing [Trichoderma arundinaceum]
MTPPPEVTNVPIVGEGSSLNKPIVPVDVQSVPANSSNVASTASSYAQSTFSPVQASYPEFQIEEHPIDQVREIRVAVIGAGLSGITAGVLLPRKVPGINLVIFEKNADVGGTWYENVYPGVRCDIPANVYQSTFSPNTQWSEEYAQGAEIRDYWQSVARKYDVYKHLRLRHSIARADWNAVKAKWELTIEKLESREIYTEEFDIVITAIGIFNAWKMPDYPGIDKFQGHLRHSSNWDPDFDPTGKRVAVIGNGASGIQVVANLQKAVKHLDHYARSKTWIAGSFGGEGTGTTLDPKYYHEDLLKSFEDPVTYHKFRKELESKFYQHFSTIFKSSKPSENLREEFKKLMAQRLQKKPELLDSLVPDFSPHCRRLTPGPGYLEALVEENVTFIQSPIQRFTEDGIVAADGVERKVDAVICATGANIDMAPPFPITAHNNSLEHIWKPHPIAYFGVAHPSFPNLLFIQGPNANGHAGTIPNQAEAQVTYIAKILRKVSQQGIKTFAPSQAATDDLSAYSDAFFPRTVFSENCSSWANGGRPGARNHAHWPGSASHANWARRDPRWEDWDWTYRAPSGNRFAWFGNGWTAKEISGEGDLTAYLKLPEEIDLRSYHEQWFEGIE